MEKFPNLYNDSMDIMKHIPENPDTSSIDKI